MDRFKVKWFRLDRLAGMETAYCPCYIALWLAYLKDQTMTTVHAPSTLDEIQSKSR